MVFLYREAAVDIGMNGKSAEIRLELMLAMKALGKTGSLALNFGCSGRIEGGSCFFKRHRTT